MSKLLVRLWKDESGTEVIEYALLLGLVILGAMVLLTALGIKVADRWREVLELL